MANTSPTVLILLSTYNGAAFLAEQLDSIIAQELQNWTLLIRDDGSSDHTPSLIQQYTERDARIHFAKDQYGNLGIRKSFSELMGHAVQQTADYIFFCDQDDVWLSDKLVLQVQMISEMQEIYGEKTPLLVHSDLCVVDGQLNVVHPSFLSFEKITRNIHSPIHTLLINNFVTGCTLGMNRTLLNKAFPVPNEVMMHDWWCALCAVAWGGKIGFVDKATVLYRQHGNNSVGSQGFYGKLQRTNYFFVMFSVIKKILKLFLKLVFKGAFLKIFKKNKRVLLFVQLFVQDKDYLTVCMAQAEHLLNRLSPHDAHYNLIKCFTSIRQQSVFSRLRSVFKLRLKSTHKMRGIKYCLLVLMM